MPPASPAPNAPSPAQMNFAARNLILRGGNVGGRYIPPAIDMWQPQQVVLPATVGFGTIINFTPRNVGMIKRLIFRFKATITAGANDLALTPWGLANFISNVTFNDLGNNQRINTTGWHLTAVATAKRRRVFAAAYTSDNPFGYGSINTLVSVAPATITSGNTGTVVFELEVPFSKNDSDLRGVIFGDVTNANMQVNLTINPNMIVANGADPTNAVYQGTAGAGVGTISAVTVKCFQNYLDQLPRNPSNGQLILPNQDLATAYLLNNAVSTVPIANSDNSFAFTNARTYESITFGYDNNGTLNINGSDLNYVQLQSANFTNIINVDGPMLGLMDRNAIMDDFPKGMYYLDFRHRPIDTNQYGNMQLVINPSTVGGSGAYFLYGLEAFGIIGLVNQGGSINSGG